MKKLFYAVVACVTLLTSSCALVGTPVGIGSIYTDVTSGEAATSNSIGKKVGEAKATNVLGIIASGDASITAAAKKAGIKKISHVDSKKTSILGIFGTYTTIVYGD